MAVNGFESFKCYKNALASLQPMNNRGWLQQTSYLRAPIDKSSEEKITSSADKISSSEEEISSSEEVIKSSADKISSSEEEIKSSAEEIYFLWSTSCVILI